MNFIEATQSLKEGQSIRRKSWPAFVHLKIIKKDILVYNIDEQKTKNLIDDIVKGYRQEAVPFTYDVSIMLSNDWLVIDGNQEEIIDFPQAVEKLKHRFKVRLKDWPNTTFLELHPGGKELFMRKLCEYDYTPTFECFAANDWETME